MSYTVQEIEQALVNAHEAGDTEAASSLTEYLQQQRSIQAESDPFENISNWEELSYGYAKKKTDVGNWAMWLESRFPMGQLTTEGYKSPTELYGEDFLAADPDERLEILKQADEIKLQQDYPELYSLSQQGRESGLTTAGAMANYILTPSNLPFLNVTKPLQAAAVGGVLGAETTAAEQMAAEGRITDAKSVIVDGVIEATLAGGITKAVNKFSQYRKAKKDTKVVNASNDMVDNISLSAAKAVSAGVPNKDLRKFISDDLGLDEETINAGVAIAERKPIVPASAEEARVLLETTQEVTDPVNYKRGKWAADYLETISDRVGRINGDLKIRLREHDMNGHIRKHQKLLELRPFMTAISKKAIGGLTKSERKEVGLYLKNGEYDSVIKVLNRHGNIKVGSKFKPEVYTPEEAVTKLRNTLEGTAQELEGIGVKVNRVENYYPRKVKDLDGLLDKLGRPIQGIIQVQLRRAASALGKSVDTLTESQREEVINNTLRGYSVNTGKGGLSFTKSRTIPKVTEDLSEFYEDDMLALQSYVVRSVDKLEEAKFFSNAGGKVKYTDDGLEIDYGSSIGSMTDKLLAKGQINNAGQSDLGKLLSARFEAPKKSPSKFFQGYRTGNYMFTIGNPFSALNQIPDLGITATTQGMANAFGQFFNMNKPLRIKDFGLDDYLTAELSTVNDFSKGLHNLFKYTGFRFADRLGKETLMNAAYQKARKIAKNPKAGNDIELKYKSAFGDEYDLFLKDLNEGRISERVKLYVFNELADAQPISMSEVPYQYAIMENGRLLYTLKTFGLRQLGLVKDNIRTKWKQGKKLGAAKNLAMFATIPPLLGANMSEVQDFILGEGYDPNDIPDEMLNRLLAMGFASRYNLDKAVGSGKTGEVLGNLIMPPTVIIDNTVSDLAALFKYAETGEMPPEGLLEETMKDFPAFGKFLKAYLYGGLEDNLTKEFKKDTTR